MLINTMKRLFTRIPLTGIFVMILFLSQANAQMVDIPSHQEFESMYSGIHQGDGGSETVIAYKGVLTVTNSPWLRLQFESANLGEASFIKIRSTKDGKWQKLDQINLMQWEYSSAYFNGNSLEIELHVAPLDRDIFFKIDEQIVGDWVRQDFEIESQCGPTDDRIHSSQMATGRLMGIGCTAWIIPNGHFVSAGHCVGSGANVVEFQVPPSLPGGTVQHPGPEDQYAVISSSIVGTAGGVGNDWGSFEVSPNSITGLMPKDAQGAYWPLMQDLGPDSIRITGYGVDNGVDNQVQQTHVGPNAGSSGTTMRYVTDTEGGNSGSPVIDPATGYAVGVHTHGGCSSSGGNNNGTSLFNTAFWDAVEQGAGGCGVEPASNPNPAHAATDVSINLTELAWTNGAGAVTNELYFGTDPSTLVLVQSGTLATSWTITGGPLEYGTDYYWKVVEIGDTCTTPAATWSFLTENHPLLVVETVNVYPQSVAMWTGTTDGATKTDGEVRAWDAEDGWFMYDISAIPDIATITLVTFNGYVNATNWPYWSATPLPGLDPLTASAADLKTAIEANSGDGTAYVWSNEGSGFTTGQYVYATEVWTNTDLQAALPQDWFAVGCDSRDNSATYYIVWDGWSQSSIPYLEVTYEYVVPVELTSFAASVNDGNVTLNWTTATETNNHGFEVQRSSNGTRFDKVGYVAGHGTVTETMNYVFTDSKVDAGSYSYRLKQIDFDGNYEYTEEIEVLVSAPKDFALQQNYPNPFNPETKIEFSLKTDSKVTLVVFDILGQEVIKLISSNLTAGIHEINFDASALNSGVYLYRIDATGIDGSSFTSVKKMILMK